MYAGCMKTTIVESPPLTPDQWAVYCLVLAIALLILIAPLFIGLP
jgi:hypothetical protein